MLEWTSFSTLMGQTQKIEHLHWPGNISMKFHIFSLTNQKNLAAYLNLKHISFPISKWILSFWGLYFNLSMLNKMFIHTARNLSIYHSIVCLIFAAAQHQVKKWKTLPSNLDSFRKIQFTTHGECSTCCQHLLRMVKFSDLMLPLV